MVNSSYFKNIELANEFGISSVSIGRYIEQAVSGINKIQVINVRGKFRIRRNDYNYNVIKELTSDEKRFKNKGIQKNLTVNEKVYTLFNKKQILEILSNLENKNYLPLKFAYFVSPKEWWPNYQNEKDSKLNQKISLQSNLQDQLLYIKNLCELTHSKLNIVQMGTSYKYISKTFINTLIKDGLIHSYTVVDINSKSLELEQLEISKILPKEYFKKVQYDFERSYCKNFIYEALNSFNEPNVKTINLFLSLGANLSNYPTYSKVIECIGDISSKGDVLIYDLVMRHSEVMYITNFSKGTERYNFLIGLPKLLGFEEEKILLNTDFDQNTKIRSVFFEIIENTSIIFDNLYLGKQIAINFKKGDRINLMTTRVSDFIYDFEMLTRKGYLLTKSTLSENEKFITLLARKK
jgi:hypothetical protein